MNNRAAPAAWLKAISQTADEIVLELGGELDLSTVSDLADTLDQLLVQPPATLVFELRQLRFIDSSGLALLITTTRRVQRVELRYPTNHVRRVIELAGLSGTLPIRT